nr:hypothetical protein CFP56_60856 [Quercus suber]
MTRGKVAAPREEIASLRLSLEAEIDQFCLKEEGKKPKELVVQVLDLEDELDRFLGVLTLRLVIARMDDNLEDEKEMALNRKKGLKELLAERNKELAQKGASGSQHLPAFRLPPSAINLLLMHNLKKKRKENKVAEEGEVVPQKEPEQQKTVKDKGRASLLELRMYPALLE